MSTVTPGKALARPQTPLSNLGSSRSARILWRFGKRGFDIVAAAVVLIVAMPLLIAIAVAVKLDSAGPIFYRANRVGFRGQPLPMLKFRKMRDNATGAPLTAVTDERLTRVGALLVRARLDELPQLWDVLRGRMSIVGPRPESPGFVSHHAAAYREILSVRPGITGPSQVAFTSESSILNADDPVTHYLDRILPQKVGIDLLYAHRSGLLLDAKVIFWTVVSVVLRRQVAVHRQTLRMNLRRRPAVKPATEIAESRSAAIASSQHVA